MNRVLLGANSLDHVRTVVYEVQTQAGEMGEWHSHNGFTMLTLLEGEIYIETWAGMSHELIKIGETRKEGRTLHRVIDCSDKGSRMIVVIQHNHFEAPMKDERGNELYI